MRKILGSSIALAAIAGFALAFAQPRPPTTEERVTALESALATLETRFGLESSRQPTVGGESGLAIQSRVTTLERSLERLAVDIQRVERLADTAVRDAAAAQRDAMTAQQIARDAAMRVR
jgi:hypothetical protein